MRKWRDLSPAERAAREQLTGKWGRAGLLIGVILIATTFGWGAYVVQGGGEIACPPAQEKIAETATVVYTAQKDLQLNSTLCLAVNPAKYFATEIADIVAAQAAVKKAEEVLAQAEKEPGAGKAPKVEAAKKELEAAKTKLQAIKTKTRTASVFINDIRTPLVFELYVEETPPGESGWVWKPVKVIAPEDAASDAGKVWRQILAGTPLPGIRSFKLGIGDSDGKLPRPHAVWGEEIKLQVYVPLALLIGALGMLSAAAGLFALGWYSPLLRDRTSGDAKDAPFSLARTQFAWWFFLVFGGFLFVWLVTGQYLGVITAGALALMGISGMSGVAAQVMDRDPGAANPPGNAANPNPPPTTNGFLMDILSEDAGVSMHRVQMAAWTLILGLIFLWSVFWAFSFPNFDTNILVLAGIVNGIYLGFKFK